MGIKGWLSIGGAALGIIGIALGIKRKEDVRYDHAMMVMNEVDLVGAREEEPKSVEVLKDEVEEAMAAIDIDEEDEEEQDKDSEEIVTDENKTPEEEKTENISEESEESYEDSEKEAVSEEMELEEAIRNKDYLRLERIFNRMYNPYPYSESPASLYGKAVCGGLITREFEAEAAKRYGKMWFYSGD